MGGCYRTVALSASIAFGCGSLALADSPASNTPYVVAEQSGPSSCYAKAMPKMGFGEAGFTQIFRFKQEAEELLTTFDWYARGGIALRCYWSQAKGDQISVVRFGPWAGGRIANETLAIAFYLNGQIMRSYSTLDIAGRPENVRASVSHHRVIQAVWGYGGHMGKPAFDILTVDGRLLSFDPMTGDLLSK